ncbi:glycine--tRNA ligase subunit beta [Alteromonas sp. 5E99-2]|uniref:glycine--tRNA ligase subunit beta n=1 Tax=Alteromonas sp. 5E99-2 TaxID=2817683 RepID=UPI001A99CB8A|nr:glycine--tRNA ligase subunit beta [Alteromonas sp. 5E99-2]MBO1256796.1 glycine--tRNA ligase subunit beta [Alteromonas sp. 5E99-2]
MSHNDALLIEIGTEELPPKILKSLGEQFANNIHNALIEANYAPESFEWFASPRRLAILVSSVSSEQPDVEVEKRGPAVSAAFDSEGNPTKAALGWAKGNGIDIADAQRLVTDKGEWLLHKATVKGQHISSAIGEMVTQALKKLPIPKPMRWGNNDYQFIRPIHTLTILYGSDILKAEVLGISSNNLLRGHRFHGNKTFTLTHAKEYENTLINHYVVGSFSRRVDTIKSTLDLMADSMNLKADYSVSLLEEIASLVEWPKVLQAKFEERFLSVPKEALIYTMKDDQKYVPLLNSDGSLSHHFLFVSNIDSKKPELVVEGNEKVIRPRLADAEFFFETDKKRSLYSRVEDLGTVVFQKKLGTLKDKVTRISNTAERIASLIGSDSSLAARAGLLSKSDLMTEMVMEFTEVQGVMGRYYAAHDNEPEEVSLAIEEQYLPKFSGDVLPQSTTGMCVSLADKLDTLVGIFGIEQKPKGDKDPFALRRAAIGILRIISESGLDLDLQQLISTAALQYPEGVLVDNGDEVIDFVLSRFSSLLQEKGYGSDVIQAVSIRRPTKPDDFVARVAAVEAFKQLPEAEALSAANKRVANILAKQKVASDDIAVDAELFESEYESNLYRKITELSGLDIQDHSTALSNLASLRSPIDAFFDNVMVMAENEEIKRNRLALLNQLRSLFLRTADISVLAK